MYLIVANGICVTEAQFSVAVPTPTQQRVIVTNHTHMGHACAQKLSSVASSNAVVKHIRVRIYIGNDNISSMALNTLSYEAQRTQQSVVYINMYPTTT
jgi:hypothetical protein